MVKTLPWRLKSEDIQGHYVHINILKYLRPVQ